MAMPSTYLTLEQLKRARSAQRGDRFNRSAQQASQSVRMGLDDIRKIRMEDEARARAAKQAQAAQAMAARKAAIQEKRASMEEARYGLDQARFDWRKQREGEQLAAKKRDQAVEEMRPGMVGEQVKNLQGQGFAGGIDFDVSGAEPKATELDPRQAGELDATESYKEAGIAGPQAQSLAREATAGAEEQIAKGQRQSAADAMAKADAERKAAESEERIRASKSRTALGWAQRKDRKKADDPSKQPPPDRITLEQMTNLKKAAVGARQLLEMKKGIDTGPLAGRFQNLKSDAGINDPEWKAFNAKAKSLLKTIAKAKEGGRLTDFDMRFYEKALFDVNQQDQNFVAVVDQLISEIEGDLAMMAETQRAYGKDVSPFDAGAASTPAQGRKYLGDDAMSALEALRAGGASDEEIKDEIRKLKAK